MKLPHVISNTWLLGVIGLVVALHVFWVLAWLIAPPLFKSQAQRIASERLGRTVTIGAVDFKPWSLELTVTDVAVARSGTSDGPTVQLTLPRLYVDAEILSLFKLAAVADTVVVEKPRLLVTHLADGDWDIDDIVAELRRPDEPAADPAGESFPFSLH